MRRKSHVRFWNGGGVGDRPADRNGGRAVPAYRAHRQKERRGHSRSAFDGLCSAFIQLNIAQGDRDAARVWLDVWERTEPDDPQLAGFRKALGVKARRV